jgi:DNA-binding XRE family transcriptional regulator
MPLRIDSHHKRAPREELTRLRKERGGKAGWFAARLGVSRMHMTSIERGRRDPSLELVSRWMELLPEATLDMFQPMPAFEQAVRTLGHLKIIDPEIIKAA